MICTSLLKYSIEARPASTYMALVSAASPSSDPFSGLSRPFLFPQNTAPGASNIGGAGWRNDAMKSIQGNPIDAAAPPMPTPNSARPGRGSNSTIPYTRVCSLDAARLAGTPGNVTFVSKSHSALSGCGTERKSLLASIDMLNARLSVRDDGNTTLPVGGDPYLDWDTVAQLDEWRLDGVILGNPDDSNSNSTHDLVDGRMEGTTPVNVCIAGQAAALNVYQPDRSHLLRLFPLDEVFVGLFATNKTDHWSFQWHPFGVQALREPALGLLAGLGDLVGAWRVGIVTDTRAAFGGWPKSKAADDMWEHRITLDVRVEWIPVVATVWFDVFNTGDPPQIRADLLERFEPPLSAVAPPPAMAPPPGTPPGTPPGAPTPPGTPPPGAPKAPDAPQLLTQDSDDAPGEGPAEKQPDQPPDTPQPPKPAKPAPQAPQQPSTSLLKEPQLPAAPSGLETSAGWTALDGFLQQNSLSYDTLQSVLQGVSNGSQNAGEDVLLGKLIDYMFLNWSLKHPALVRYVRAGGRLSGKDGEKLTQWLLLEGKLKNARNGRRPTRK